MSETDKYEALAAGCRNCGTTTSAAAYLREHFVTREEADKYRIMLLDLLAVIHRDGGYKTQDIGIALAHEQALRLSAERIVEAKELATLTAERDRLRAALEIIRHDASSDTRSSATFTRISDYASQAMESKNV